MCPPDDHSYTGPRACCAATLNRAEDVVQDALDKLHRNWSRVTRANNVEGYVRRILVNSH